MTRGTPDDPGGAEAFTAYREKPYFGNLDGLRFICIVMVLWHHNPAFKDSGVQLLDRGFMGVDFFFVLSGYLITTLLLREIATYGNFSLRDFYQRRLVRIVPVYFFVVTCVGAYYIFVKGETQYLQIWVYYYAFLSNFLTEHIPLLTITWSLAVEEQYYMLWPLIMLLVPVRFLWQVCLVLIALNVMGIMGVFGTLEARAGPLLFHLRASTYAPIILGSLAALLLHHRNSFVAIHRLIGGYATALVLFIALIAALQFTPENVTGWPNLIIHTVMTLVLMSLVLRERTILTPALTQRFVARVGVISYGIYLYHLIALDVVSRLDAALFAGRLPDWVSFVSYSLIAVVIADISFRTLENWFRRFRPKPRPAPEPTHVKV